MPIIKKCKQSYKSYIYLQLLNLMIVVNKALVKFSNNSNEIWSYFTNTNTHALLPLLQSGNSISFPLILGVQAFLVSRRQ